MPDVQNRGEKMTFDAKQLETLNKIRAAAKLLEVDADWAAAIAMTESALGSHQLSKTGARGVFQMTTVAMKDLLAEMQKSDDDLIDIACGVLFLRLLLKRWKTQDEATAKFCDPNDRAFYIGRVHTYMQELKGVR
jgi:membrane-bound lytic murein transglycosylase MltF